MLSLLKRELLVWLVAALLIGGYVALGNWLAPEVPPEPKKGGANIVNVGNLQDLAAKLKADAEARDQYKAALLARQEFLLRWYQWGAGVGLVLVFAYSWWRPPWHATENRGDPERTTTTFWERSPISRQAALMMAATVALVIVLVVLLATAFK